MPYSLDLESSLYAQSNISNTNNDWGVYCKISNGGNYEWRTLDSHDWEFIISHRPNADKKRGFAEVNGVSGYILLPEIWETPSDCSFTANTAKHESNIYSTEQWQSMENAGAVFLPATGYRKKTAILRTKEMGWYYSSSWTEASTTEDGTSYRAQPIRFHFNETISKHLSSSIFTGTGEFGAYGTAVSLAKTVQEAPSQNAIKQ